MSDLINENLSVFHNPNSTANERQVALASLSRLAATGNQRAKDGIAELAIGGNDAASDIIRHQQRPTVGELSPEACALLAATGKSHLAQVDDDAFLDFTRKRGIQPSSREYDELRNEWRNFRAPAGPFLRAEYLAFDGDTTHWALLKYWVMRWRKHLLEWCATPRKAGDVPGLPIELRFAEEKLAELLKDPQTLPWQCDSVQLFMALVMFPEAQGDFIAKYGPNAFDLWRPDPDGSGNLITEGELMERSFPRGEHGSRRLYDRMAVIRQLFATGVHEYNGADTAKEEHRSRELYRKALR